MWTDYSTYPYSFLLSSSLISNPIIVSSSITVLLSAKKICNNNNKYTENICCRCGKQCYKNRLVKIKTIAKALYKKYGHDGCHV